MKFFKRSHDGGKDSGVEGLFLVEIKSLFSIVLLSFNKGSREAYHSHAFNALTWWVRGSVVEYHVDGREIEWTPSIIPKLTRKNCFHKIYALRKSYAISFRGPWDKTWQEKRNNEIVTLTHGRTLVDAR